MADVGRSAGPGTARGARADPSRSPGPRSDCEDSRRAARRARPGCAWNPGSSTCCCGTSRGQPGAASALARPRADLGATRGATLTVDGYRATGGSAAPCRSRPRRSTTTSPGPAAGCCGADAPTGLGRTRGRGGAQPGYGAGRWLASGPARLVETLVGCRLVTSDEGMITLAHEALARAWPRLRGWLDDDVEGRRILQHLRPAPRRGKRSAARRASCTAAPGWPAPTSGASTQRCDPRPVETAFLDAGSRLAEDEERSAEEPGPSPGRDQPSASAPGRRPRRGAGRGRCRGGRRRTTVESCRSVRGDRTAAAPSRRTTGQRKGRSSRDDLSSALLLAVAAARVDRRTPTKQLQANSRSGARKSSAPCAVQQRPGRAAVVVRTQGRTSWSPTRGIEPGPSAADDAGRWQNYRSGPGTARTLGSPPGDSRSTHLAGGVSRPITRRSVRLLDPATLAPCPSS